MKTISPYSFAAALILIRFFALSVYVPSASENPAVSAAAVIAFSLVKLIALLPICFLMKKKEWTVRTNKTFTKISAAAFAIVAAAFLLMLCDGFSVVIESVYPERFGKIGVVSVLLFICAYVGSMGVNSVVKTSSLILPFVIALMGLTFFEMRDNLLIDRINLYSDNVLRELSHTFRNFAKYLIDFFVFFGLLPYLKNGAYKAAKLYIIVDCMISVLFFLTSSAVMGGFWSKFGYAFFTLSYSTHGFVIDRSDGMFLAISTCCAVITGAALMVILKDSLKYLFALKNDQNVFLCSAAVLTIVVLAAQNIHLRLHDGVLGLSVGTACVLFAASLFGLMLGRTKKHERRKHEA